jgi:hypothetical protein
LGGSPHAGQDQRPVSSLVRRSLSEIFRDHAFLA